MKGLIQGGGCRREEAGKGGGWEREHWRASPGLGYRGFLQGRTDQAGKNCRGHGERRWPVGGVDQRRFPRRPASAQGCREELKAGSGRLTDPGEEEKFNPSLVNERFVRVDGRDQQLEERVGIRRMGSVCS